MRAGLGVDAHRFLAGRKLFLGGIEVAHSEGLAGHSDADVVLHALMDAILGACGAGDIGELFGDTDEKYRDASSVELLAEVMSMVTSLGFKVANADIVVICEEPKIGPCRQRMREKIAGVLGVGAEAVSVKGTTTEGMGFTGRGEGICAMATVLVE
ncbi:MAG TPA: 2-C-methyl-D-erythritol 2,4-cyclodiphosphate synthase [Candidatus Anoxymicrobiaceae bacterium]